LTLQQYLRGSTYEVEAANLKAKAVPGRYIEIYTLTRYIMSKVVLVRGPTVTSSGRLLCRMFILSTVSRGRKLCAALGSGGFGRLFLVQRSGNLIRAWGDTRLIHGAACSPVIILIWGRYWDNIGVLWTVHSNSGVVFHNPTSAMRIGAVDHCRVQRA